MIFSSIIAGDESLQVGLFGKKPHLSAELSKDPLSLLLKKGLVNPRDKLNIIQSWLGKSESVSQKGSEREQEFITLAAAIYSSVHHVDDLVK